jgi:hypothetical protein
VTGNSDNNENAYRVIETTVISQITVVRVYDSTAHHIAEEHPEFTLLPCVEGAIDNTVAAPHKVYASNPPHLNSFKYVSHDNTFGGNPMVVAVKVVEGTSGLLKTVYFPDSVSGELIWSKDGE